MDAIDINAFGERAQVVRRMVAEVEAGRLMATEYERGYLAGWLATLEDLANGTENQRHDSNGRLT